MCIVLTDEEIIKLVMYGNTNAFATLIDKYKNKVYSMAYYYTKNGIDADDLSQEIFIKSFKCLKKFKGKSKFSTWLYKLSKNYCIDWLRKRKIPNDFVKLREIASDENVLDFIINRNYYSREEIATLPNKYKLPILLYHFKDYNYEQIAKILSIPKRTVETRIYRARKLLKDKLVLRGFI